jgi:hypothetical protein
MAFKPNYGRDRAERNRAAKSRKDEKLQKLQERVEKRKAEREGIQKPPESEQS